MTSCAHCQGPGPLVLTALGHGVQLYLCRECRVSHGVVERDGQQPVTWSESFALADEVEKLKSEAASGLPFGNLARLEDKAKIAKLTLEVKNLEAQVDLVRWHPIDKYSMVKRAVDAESDARRLRGFLKQVRDGFDCDKDAHRYNALCRCCSAAAILSDSDPYNLDLKPLMDRTPQSTTFPADPRCGAGQCFCGGCV